MNKFRDQLIENNSHNKQTVIEHNTLWCIVLGNHIDSPVFEWNPVKPKKGCSHKITKITHLNIEILITIMMIIIVMRMMRHTKNVIKRNLVEKSTKIDKKKIETEIRKKSQILREIILNICNQVL